MPDFEVVVLCRQIIERLAQQDVVRRLIRIQQRDLRPVLRVLQHRIDDLQKKQNWLVTQVWLAYSSDISVLSSGSFRTALMTNSRHSEKRGVPQRHGTWKLGNLH